ncbi:MAG TPA: alpha/beta hydrolase, partial [Aggregatilineaceae bacterium]|nr:alpha/beta hydrolase [Aggregatilineaceae bacterium]
DAGPALIIGTSMGAGAAVCAAADGPERVAGIVLIGPFVRVIGPQWQSRLMATVLSQVFANPLWGVSMWSRYYTSLYPTARPADFADYLTRLKRNLREPGRLNALKAMLADTKAGSDARLSSVKAPIHILMGTRDPDFKQPEAEVRLLAERLHATSRMIDGAGHYPHAEMPEPTLASILGFFETIRVPAAHGN